MREAAFALGKTRITTIRRVLLPSVRSNMATGVTLGISRIIGDTAIVVLLLGETLRVESQGSVPVVGLLRGTGSTLTSYVLDNSPAGEGGGAAEGLRGRGRADDVRARPEPARRTHRAPQSGLDRPVGRRRRPSERGALRRVQPGRFTSRHRAR